MCLLKTKTKPIVGPIFGFDCLYFFFLASWCFTCIIGDENEREDVCRIGRLGMLLCFFFFSGRRGGGGFSVLWAHCCGVEVAFVDWGDGSVHLYKIPSGNCRVDKIFIVWAKPKQGLYSTWSIYSVKANSFLTGKFLFLLMDHRCYTHLRSTKTLLLFDACLNMLHWSRDTIINWLWFFWKSLFDSFWTFKAYCSD